MNSWRKVTQPNKGLFSDTQLQLWNLAPLPSTCWFQNSQNVIKITQPCNTHVYRFVSGPMVVLSVSGRTVNSPRKGQSATVILDPVQEWKPHSCRSIPSLPHIGRGTYGGLILVQSTKLFLLGGKSGGDPSFFLKSRPRNGCTQEAKLYNFQIF